MKTVILGSTGITTPQNAFGALPVQRDDMETSIKILRAAYDGGMNFFDTARAYSDSEEKIGKALSDVRENIFIATKTAAETPEEFWKDLETSLSLLKTDYVDIYQFHQASRCYKPGDGTGMYEAMLEAKAQGKIRHIGITAHKIKVAQEAVQSGLYETLQFPLSYLSGEQEIELVENCRKNNMGFIAMKALAGGLINKSAAAFAFMSQFDNVLPIWGIQRMTELDEFLGYMENPPKMEGEILEIIKKDREELAGDFCRGCGYCLPCPAGIKIYDCARMSQLIRRAPSKNWISEEWQEEMAKIENCIRCGSCHKKCPYGLDAAELLKKNLEDYKKIIAGEIKV